MLSNIKVVMIRYMHNIRNPSSVKVQLVRKTCTTATFNLNINNMFVRYEMHQLNYDNKNTFVWIDIL